MHRIWSFSPHCMVDNTMTVWGLYCLRNAGEVDKRNSKQFGTVYAVGRKMNGLDRNYSKDN
jgi:hypothetical protein